MVIPVSRTSRVVLFLRDCTQHSNTGGSVENNGCTPSSGRSLFRADRTTSSCFFVREVQSSLGVFFLSSLLMGSRIGIFFESNFDGNEKENIRVRVRISSTLKFFHGVAK
jgi:hypothetical protein